MLRANTGRLLVLVSGNGATTVYAVIHAPLAAVWIFAAPPPATEVLASGKISGRLIAFPPRPRDESDAHLVRAGVSTQ